MRFSIQNKVMIPESLFPLLASTNPKPISQINEIPQPSLNPDFPYNKELQSMLIGMQLLLSDLPFPIDIIQSHYENGFLQYRKSIEVKNDQPTCVRCGNKVP